MFRIVSFVIALSVVSAPALAEEIIMKCENGGIYKYSSSFIWGAKVEERNGGRWLEWCRANSSDENAYLEVADQGAACNKRPNKNVFRPYIENATLDFLAMTFIEKNTLPKVDQYKCRRISRPQ